MAAFVILRHCTTAERIWRSRSLRRRPIRFSQSLSSVTIDFIYIDRAKFPVPSVAHPITVSMRITLQRGKPALDEGNQRLRRDSAKLIFEAPPMERLL